MLNDSNTIRGIFSAEKGPNFLGLFCTPNSGISSPCEVNTSVPERLLPGNALPKKNGPVLELYRSGVRMVEGKQLNPGNGLVL